MYKNVGISLPYNVAYFFEISSKKLWTLVNPFLLHNGKFYTHYIAQQYQTIPNLRRSQSYSKSSFRVFKLSGNWDILGISLGPPEMSLGPKWNI